MVGLGWECYLRLDPIDRGYHSPMNSKDLFLLSLQRHGSGHSLLSLSNAWPGIQSILVCLRRANNCFLRCFCHSRSQVDHCWIVDVLLDLIVDSKKRKCRVFQTGYYPYHIIVLSWLIGRQSPLRKPHLLFELRRNSFWGSLRFSYFLILLRCWLHDLPDICGQGPTTRISHCPRHIALYRPCYCLQMLHAYGLIISLF